MFAPEACKAICIHPEDFSSHPDLLNNLKPLAKNLTHVRTDIPWGSYTNTADLFHQLQEELGLSVIAVFSRPPPFARHPERQTQWYDHVISLLAASPHVFHGLCVYELVDNPKGLLFESGFGLFDSHFRPKPALPVIMEKFQDIGS